MKNMTVTEGQRQMAGRMRVSRTEEEFYLGFLHNCGREGRTYDRKAAINALYFPYIESNHL